MVRRLPCAFALLAAAALGFGAPFARGQQDDSDARGVPSVFFVAKSENGNQVHYGIALDRRCAPMGDSPVYAYWRMLEHGPLAREPLLAREVAAYGFAAQRVLARDDHGGRVRIALNALPRRTIVVESTERGSGCTATARATIGGAAAALTSVFVQLRWPFGVAYMEMSGRRESDGRALRERVAE